MRGTKPPEIVVYRRPPGGKCVVSHEHTEEGRIIHGIDIGYCESDAYARLHYARTRPRGDDAGTAVVVKTPPGKPPIAGEEHFGHHQDAEYEAA